MLFHAEVLNQRVLRHEENAAPCPVTCNGAPQPGRPASGPWSKTMMGSDPEDRAYAIELTHTYGVTKDSGGYHPGTHPALSALAVVVPDPVASSDAAAKLGYPSAPLRLGDAHLVWGPDDYRYVLLPQQRLRGRAPRVHHVAIRVSDLRRSVAFYTSLLGMAELPDERVAAARALAVGAAGLASGSPTVYSASVMSAVLGYNGTEGGGVGSAAGSQWGQNDQQIPIVLLDDGVAVTHTSWAGRHAIALPDEAIRRVSARLEAQQNARREARERMLAAARGQQAVDGGPLKPAELPPDLGGRVIHPLQELPEALGTLLLLIVADPDGHELCLVSRATFEREAAAATDFRPPDWDRRDQIEAAAAAAAAAPQQARSSAQQAGGTAHPEL